MRYGKITQHYPEHHIQPLMNIGDIIQTIAVEYLYQLMGVSTDQIIGISKYSLNSYQGEKVVVPITGFFNERPDMGEVPFSDNIIPVFLGYHLGWGLHNEKVLEFFKKYQPIGCRDSFTQKAFEALGVSAYVCGCPTIIFPRRVKSNKYDKVFFVDTPKELDNFVPSKIKNKIEYISHIVTLKKVPLSCFEYEELVGYTQSLLNRYRDEAALVVTSRIHCAIPCIAMGIPVIFTPSNMIDAYDFMLNLLDVYTPDKFKEINWNPEIIELEHLKKDFLSIAHDLLKTKKNLYVNCQILNDFYQSAHDIDYYLNERLKLEELFYENDEAEYVIWGVGSLGSLVFRLMQKYFPKANLIYCCDSFAMHDFFGNDVIRPNQLPSAEKGIKILAATSYGIVESERFLVKAGYVKGINYNNFFENIGVRK